MSFLRRKGVAGFGLFALAMLLLLVLSSPLAADEGRELPTTLHDFDERFFRAADQLEYAIEGGAEIEFYEKLVELEALLQQARLNSASSLSAALIEKALSLQAGDLRDKYLLAAERLSPKHPFIRYQLTKAREGEARWGEVFLLLHTLSSAPVLHLSLFSLKAPFLLFGGTLTLLLGGLVLLLRSFAVSGRGRAPFSIIGGALSLGLAITLGPLALLFWLAVVLRRRARGYLFASGVLFLLWGLFSPGYSSLSSWVHHGTDPSRLSVLPSSFVLFFERDLPKSGFQSVTERAALTDGDPLLTALQIRFFVEQHDYDSAFTLLEELEAREGRSSWTLFNRGFIAILQQRWKVADKLLTDAMEVDGASARELFWNSKVQFSLLNTAESRALFLQARQLDAELITQLEQEESFDPSWQRSISESFTPPLSFFVKSLYGSSSVFSPSKCTEKVTLLFRGVPPVGLFVIGLLLLSLFFLDPRGGRWSARSEEGRGFLLRAVLLVIPGAPFLGRGGVLSCIGFSLLFLAVVVLQLFLLWPSPIGVLAQTFPQLTDALRALALLGVVFGTFAGWFFLWRSSP